ncbi:hypothetical protein [uncultured Parasphingorhabdus sp.]|uniref:hypothetical protein n=1 Tax=uncultured Parasphingorhabdus sp. TaxID=2709694 RepID=UPI0030D83B13|tara:strand:+ start:97820 stop:98074 length:255 start_codon:yes stop_codon:yes gene_type:complete
MDGLLLIFLLLGATPGVSSDEAASSGTRAQAVASANILRGEVIRLGNPASRVAAKDSSNRFAVQRSAGQIADIDGGTIQILEFQ